MCRLNIFIFGIFTSEFNWIVFKLTVFFTLVVFCVAMAISVIPNSTFFQQRDFAVVYVMETLAHLDYISCVKFMFKSVEKIDTLLGES